MFYREIIVTDGDAVVDSILVMASSENALTIKLEEVFLQACRENDENFDDDEYSQEDMSLSLADGIYEFDCGLVTIREPLIINADDD